MKLSAGVISLIAMLTTTYAVETPAAVGCSDEGARYRQLGLKAGSKKEYEEAAKWLRKSVDTCPTYSSYHLLGRSDQNAGNYEAALDAFNKAQTLASTTDDQAMSVARYAQVLNTMGNSVEALPLIQGARELHSNPPRWVNDLAIELDDSMANRKLSADDITRGGLGKTSAGGYLTIAALAPVSQGNVVKSKNKLKRSINYKINFEFDSTDMDQLSMDNVKTLAGVLATDAYADERIWLIGHTDERGSPDYNQRLSELRAKAVYALVIEYEPSLADRVFTKGLGESNLLYNGDSEKIHRNNRRLQIILE